MDSSVQWFSQNPYAITLAFILTALGAAQPLLQIGKFAVRATRAIWARGIIAAYVNWKSSIIDEASYYAKKDSGFLEADINLIIITMPSLMGVLLYGPISILIFYFEVNFNHPNFSAFLKLAFIFAITASLNFLVYSFLYVEHLVRRRYIRRESRKLLGG